MGSRVEPPQGSSAHGDGRRAVPPSTATGSDAPVDLPGDKTVVSQGQPIPAPTVEIHAGGNSRIDALLERDRLGHFLIEQYIGGGGMGAVFRARDTVLNRTVAIKVLTGEQARDEETLARFQNEGQSAARLDHDNIARIYHIGEDRGLHFIVFEYVEGINIRDLIARNGRLSVEDAVSYTLQIAEALTHASGRDIVHRDIKPSNVVILPDGRVKLVDMGLARQYRTGKTDEDLTASGVTLGTFDFISPEQARDPRNADVRSDIYSLGCTIYYMLTAQPPFPEGTVLQKLLQHQGDEPPDPRDSNPTVPDEIAAIVRKMLAKNPRERYQNPAELVGELLLAAQQLGLQGPGTGGVVWISPTGTAASWLERNVPWVAPMAALVCIVLFLEFFVWVPSDDAPRPSNPRVEHNSNSGAIADGVTGNQPTGDASRGVPDVVEIENESNDQHATAAGQETARDPIETTPTVATSEPPGDAANPLRRRLQNITRAAGARGTRENAGVTSAEALSSSVSVAGTETERPSIAVADAASVINVARSVDPAPPEPGLLIVAPAAEGPQKFRSLEAAATMAKNGDTIELRYTGRRAEKSMSLNNLTVTVRAGAGHEPIVAFRPSVDGSDSLQPSHGMIAVVGGTLTLEGVALELDLSEDTSGDHWSLFELQNTELVRLDRCVLTIRNAADSRTSYHAGVAFFNVTAPPGRDSIIMPDEMIMDDPDNIELNHCIVRGEAVALRSDEMQPISLVWNNGLLATTDGLLNMTGNSTPPRGTHGIRIDINHLTASVATQLCRFDNSNGPYLVNVEIRAKNSIVQVPAGAAMIEHAISSDETDMRELFQWSGHHNVYAAEKLWKRPIFGDTDAETVEWEYTDWTAYWQNRDQMSIEGPITWQRIPAPDAKMHAHAPSDYQLDVSEIFNPAVHFASDRRDAGMIADQLPRLADVATAPPVTE